MMRDLLFVLEQGRIHFAVSSSSRRNSLDCWTSKTALAFDKSSGFSMLCRHNAKEFGRRYKTPRSNKIPFLLLLVCGIVPG